MLSAKAIYIHARHLLTLNRTKHLGLSLPLLVQEDLVGVLQTNDEEDVHARLAPLIYLDWRLFGAAGWRLSALAVDLVVLQPAWRGFIPKVVIIRPKEVINRPKIEE